jgi:hypothetical protein
MIFGAASLTLNPKTSLKLCALRTTKIYDFWLGIVPMNFRFTSALAAYHQQKSMIFGAASLTLNPKTISCFVCHERQKSTIFG